VATKFVVLVHGCRWTQAASGAAGRANVGLSRVISVLEMTFAAAGELTAFDYCAQQQRRFFEASRRRSIACKLTVVSG